jgi:hypothetical protein
MQNEQKIFFMLWCMVPHIETSKEGMRTCVQNGSFFEAIVLLNLRMFQNSRSSVPFGFLIVSHYLVLCKGSHVNVLNCAKKVGNSCVFGTMQRQSRADIYTS